jgi:hypothetical protein
MRRSQSVLLTEMALVPLPSMVCITLLLYPAAVLTPLAEFRGPGVHHNFDDSDSGYDVDVDSRSKAVGGNNQRGRIILLGDGTEVLTDADDTTEMFDQGEEDKDLESQVSRGQVVINPEGNASGHDSLPEKLDVTDPTYKAVANKVHANTTEPVVSVVPETNPEAKDQ